MELSKYEIHKINDIVYYVYSIGDIDEMWSKTMEMTGAVVPYDGISYITENAGDGSITSVFRCRKDDSGPGSISETIPSDDHRKWIMDHPQNMICRLSELFSGEQIDDIQKGQRITDEIGFNHQIIMTFSDDGGMSRAVILHRSRENGEFTDKELFITKLLYVHYGSRLRGKTSGTVNDAGVKDRMFNENIEKFCSVYGLSGREKDVLIRMAENMQTNEICESLSISISTLRKHIDKIYRKLSVSSRIELNKLLINNNCFDIKDV
ncbi:MAG: hypothetical protein IJM62_06685 [Lachnospiraceae bacterium]|nr:hypothetical protein [Lachnospiraceae bacterium]